MKELFRLFQRFRAPGFSTFQVYVSALFGFLVTFGPVRINAEVKSVVLTSRSPWLHGRAMGAAGAYEKLQGRIQYEVDPTTPANRAIADLTLAPRNARGRVEFSGDFVVLRPIDPARARPAVLLEILNRGHTQAIEAFFDIPPKAPFKVEALDDLELTDALVFEQGFTMAWVGWQFDLPKGSIKLDVPTAAVNSLVREAILPHTTEVSERVDSLSTPNSYCAVDSIQANATLTVKQRFDEPGTTLPRESWSFTREEGGKAIADACSILLPKDFKAGVVYEAVYTGVQPPVAGLGLAAVRDFVSYLKFGGISSSLREHPETEQRVLGYGYSQSARFLRQYLYDGFNADEQGRKAFDGVFIASGGAGRGSFNHRYAMPGEAGNSVLSDLRPVDLFPFTDDDEVDPVTRSKDGLLDKAYASKTVPKIFYTYSSSEYWARVGSLATTTIDGTRDFPLDANARLYFFAGTPHAHSPYPPVKVSRRTKIAYENDLNFSSANWSFRALLLDLDAWIAKDEDPPASVYPRLKDGNLVPLKSVKLPGSGGVQFPESVPKNWRMDFGKDFRSSGVITNEPPRLGTAYTVLVPQVDADGNDEGGIALPFLAVPLGTFTGWNYELPRRPSFDYLAGLSGSFVSFPLTKSAGVAAGDQRASIEERYKGREDYLAKVHAAVLNLTQQRLLRKEDTPAVEAEMARYWDGLVSAR